MTKLYISPSSQQANIGLGGYIEEVQMNMIADILIPELLRHGLEVMRNNPSNTYAGHVAESDRYHPDYHIAIHSNAGGTTARGCTVYAWKPETYPDRPGALMAKAIYNRLEPLTPTEDRGVRDGSQILSEIADTDHPAVLIEIDFHDKPDGAAWIASHIPEIAHAILLGILDGLGLTYIPAADPALDYKTLYEQAQVDLSILSDELTACKDRLSECAGKIIAAIAALQ